MSVTGKLAAILELWHAEGTASIARRVLHAASVVKRRRSFRKAAKPTIVPERLTLVSTPPDPKLGGVQAQLLWRWEEETKLFPSALLYPDRRNSWRLELAHLGRRELVDLAVNTERGNFDLLDPQPALRAALDLLSAPTHIHVENLGGFDPEAIVPLLDQHSVSLFLHDFSSYCVRPNLFEQPVRSFCEYSKDLDRCTHCLARTWTFQDNPLTAHRSAVSEILKRARLVCYPSEFLRDQTLANLGVEIDARHIVVHPGIPEAETKQLAKRRPNDGVRRVAFLGGGNDHKGAEDFYTLAASFSDQLQPIEWHVFGGYGVEWLKRFRRLPKVEVHGFYHPGTLTHQLLEQRISLALHLSRFPETFSLTLSECAAAGCAVLAVDRGAYRERVGDSRLLPPGPLELDLSSVDDAINSRSVRQIEATTSRRSATQMKRALLPSSSEEHAELSS